MKDYRLSEIKEMCEERTDGDCSLCPLEDFCWNELTNKPEDWKFNIDEKGGDEE